MKRYQYNKQGMLALNPRAFLDFFMAPAEPEVEVCGNVAIVNISGPLEHHGGWYCDSYDDIRDRIEEACTGPAEVIVMKIDSPGGDVSGCFETARDIRAMVNAVGKKLITYVDGQACSAAYAFACAGEQIIIPATGFVGSIGVINTRIDVTAMDAAQGVKFALIASGSRKADGHPHKMISEAEIEETQSSVNELAQVFFDLVSELRGIDAAPLQARVLIGKAAVAAGLADKVQSFDQLLASLAGAGEEKMASKFEEARAALEEAAKGDGEEAVKARAALKAMDEEKEPEATDDEDEEPAAEDDAPPSDDEEPEAVAATVSAATAGDLATQVSTLHKQLKAVTATTEARERNDFLATRKDLAPELVKLLKTKPLAEVKAIVATIPKPKKAVAAPAVTTVAATVGAGQGNAGARLAPAAKLALDQRMGLVAENPGVQNSAYKMTLGAPISSVEPKNGATGAGKQA